MSGFLMQQSQCLAVPRTVKEGTANTKPYVCRGVWLNGWFQRAQKDARTRSSVFVHLPPPSLWWAPEDGLACRFMDLRSRHLTC
jgi:hypothetical protein